MGRKSGWAKLWMNDSGVGGWPCPRGRGPPQREGDNADLGTCDSCKVECAGWERSVRGWTGSLSNTVSILLRQVNEEGSGNGR